MNCYNSDSVYGIFSQVIRLHYNCIHTLLDEINIYPGQPYMLFALNQRDGVSQRELSEKLKISPATITVMLKRMEKVELIERKKDCSDKRIIRVYLTNRGREICLKVDETIKTISTDIFCDFTKEEQDTLYNLLLKMRGNLLKNNDDKLDI